MATIRKASHAGSWYNSSSTTLSSNLDGWLAQVPSAIEGQSLPIPGARVIIAPHAGYSYSGPAAAWAYASLDLSTTKRIFLLGPSHHYYLTGCALSEHSAYATPLGNLKVDREVVGALEKEGLFEVMSKKVDEEEHSMEMHAPYIYKMLELCQNSPLGVETPIVPIMVGNTDSKTEKAVGEILAPYMKDPGNVFVVSSDFCHWGSRFSYTYYLPSASEKGYSLRRNDQRPNDPTIAESITILDRQAMDSIETGKHDSFIQELKTTGNTVCGRHPIGVVMTALESLEAEGKGKFKFVRYERSGDPVDYSDSSVSYASAYAVL